MRVFHGLRLKLAAVAASSVVATSALAASEGALKALETLSARVVAAQAAGDGASALALAKTGAELAKQAFGQGDPRYAVALSNVALFHDLQAQPAAAEQLYRDAIDILEATLDADAPLIATVRNNLAAAVFAQCRLKEAKALYALAYASLVRTVGPGHPDARAASTNLERLSRLLPASDGHDGGETGGRLIALPQTCTMS